MKIKTSQISVVVLNDSSDDDQSDVSSLEGYVASGGPELEENAVYVKNVPAGINFNEACEFFSKAGRIKVGYFSSVGLRLLWGKCEQPPGKFFHSWIMTQRTIKNEEPAGSFRWFSSTRLRKNPMYSSFDHRTKMGGVMLKWTTLMQHLLIMLS